MHSSAYLANHPNAFPFHANHPLCYMFCSQDAVTQPKPASPVSSSWEAGRDMEARKDLCLARCIFAEGGTAAEAKAAAAAAAEAAALKAGEEQGASITAEAARISRISAANRLSPGRSNMPLMPRASSPYGSVPTIRRFSPSVSATARCRSNDRPRSPTARPPRNPAGSTLWMCSPTRGSPSHGW